MDEYVLDYLKSGEAWLLVGSGPSSAIGYPSWRQLADSAVKLCRIETAGRNLAPLEKSFEKGDFPEVFEKAAGLLGMPRLLHYLQTILPARPGRGAGESIYAQIARWPVPVYLTTNYDHELSRHLAAAGETTYIDYSNSAAHMSRLLPDLVGGIFYLHGDLRSEQGLILTSRQYENILKGDVWEYWRSKMAAVFQMNRVIVIGHSLTDQHIQHVLEAAKKGSGVVRPVCWIAPDVPYDTVREYLEKYRIRVISYDNRDGTHRNLTRLVETISEFIPPRLTVHLRPEIRAVIDSPLGSNAAATGFYVFNKLSAQGDFDEKRVSILASAIYAAIPTLATEPGFSIQHALEVSGWPSGIPVGNELGAEVARRGVEDGLLSPDGLAFRVSPEADEKLTQKREEFQHIRERFQRSVQARLSRLFPSLTATQTTELASDIDAALAGFFREGGLTLASTLFSIGTASVNSQIPTSVIGFITQAAAKYDDSLRRQAFSSVALDCFTHPDSPEREYLGRISQGFFGFHALGVFGDAASERIRHAKETVWIVDSSVLIPIIAVGCTSHIAFRETFEKLSSLGLRFFTTEGLFDETKEHLWFAEKVVKDFGPQAPEVLSAARGTAPYRKANLFLEGFINWQVAGNPADWDAYLNSVRGGGSTTRNLVRLALENAQIYSVVFSDWPGFETRDFAEAEESRNKIVDLVPGSNAMSSEEVAALIIKAKPEAEVHVIVSHERDGKYRILSEAGKSSQAWFISSTSILNRVQSDLKITWPPESFLRFASTLLPTTDQETAERAFETLLWTIAQSGLTVLDDRIAVKVFGGVIDQSRLLITDQHASYDRALADKYGTDVGTVLDQVPPLYRPLAALQLANEKAQKEEAGRQAALTVAADERGRVAKAEAELGELKQFRTKLEKKKTQAEQKRRKNRSNRGKNNKKKKKKK
jgi:SIR2-like domain